MSVKVQIKLDVESMADFMVFHIYTSGAGIAALVLGFLNVGFTMVFALKRQFLYMFIFLVFAFLILCVLPYFIRTKVNRQMAHSKRLDETVTYEFADDGITTTTPEDSGKASWGKFKKAFSRKQILILYDAQKRAIILPVDQLGENYTSVVDLIFEHMPAPAVRINRLDGKKDFAGKPGEEPDAKPREGEPEEKPEDALNDVEEKQDGDGEL